MTDPLARICADPSSPPVLVVGHVTRDLIDGEERLGGAASFASRAAAALGYRTVLVTSAPQRGLLSALEEDPRIEIRRQAADRMTTFALDYSGPRRRLRLDRRAADLEPDAVPVSARRAPVAYIAPVIGECGAALVDALDAGLIAVGAQGWMRRVDEDGEVRPVEDAASRIPACARVVVYSELDTLRPERLARCLADRAEIVAVTRAERGVTIFRGSASIDLAAEPAVEVDPTGAGDVFGMVFALGLSAGLEAEDAAHRAMWAAARVVEGPEMGALERRS